MIALVVGLAASAARAQTPSHWRYDVVENSRAGTAIVWEGSEPFGGERASYLQTVTQSADGVTRSESREYFARTGTGVAYLGERSERDEADGEEIETRIADTPQLALVAPLQVGAKWEAVGTEHVDHTGANEPVGHAGVGMRELAEVTGRERVVVPAGTFDCVVVRRTRRTEMSELVLGSSAVTEDDIAMVEDYAPSVGLVRLAATEVIEVRRGADVSRRTVTRTEQLRAYHLDGPAWQMAATGFVTSPAPPEPPDSLARRAADLIAHGDYGTACPLLDASWHAAQNLGTLLALADCHEHQGRIASAWREFDEAAASAERSGDPHAADARSHADALAPRVSRLDVVTPVHAPAQLVVRLDGADVTAQLGTSIPIDPGEHEIVAWAPGFQPSSARVSVIAEGRTSELPIAPLSPVPNEPAAPVESSTPIEPLAPPAESRRARHHKLALELGAVGLGTLLLGGGLALAANGEWNTVQSDCGGNVDACPAGQLAMAQLDTNAARAFATASTITLVAGGLIIAGAGLAWFTAPSDRHPIAWHVVPTMNARWLGLSLEGAW